MEVFFSRPGNDCEIFDRIRNDIKYAQERILCAMYSFNDDETIQLINNANLTEKYLVIDKQQFKNDNKFKIKIDDTTHVGLLGYDKKSNGLFCHMHHKFFIIDNVLWVGSFNISHSAKTRNWESCMRISDSDIVEKYVNEFWNIYLFSHIDRPWIKINEDNCVAFSDDDKEFKDSLTNFRFTVDVNASVDEEGNWIGEYIRKYSLRSIENNNKKVNCQMCNCIEYVGRTNKINYKYMYPKGFTSSAEFNICKKCLINLLKEYWKNEKGGL
ncbi:MAG: hypothetical protein IJ141_04470 [Lachnospiraceae bacterium]|nr:hypothetical protein [Lachnospiraceae bacterium]